MLFDDLWLAEEPGDPPEVFEELTACPWPPGPVPPERWVLPGVAPVARTLARGTHVCVALNGVRAWPSGATLDLVIFARRVRWPGPRSLAPFPQPLPRAGDAEGLALSVRYADGRRACTADHHRGSPRQGRARTPEDPVLRYGDGGGGPFLYRQSVHLWPLPPPGRLTVTAAWPGRGVPESRTDLDATAIRDAAGQATAIWPDLAGLPFAGGGT
ncbi:hypothetical protein ACTVZO_37710 [Streptomyces sp. IBSNAI002]|uniref:hypothetical protein n=1 Tax=Streptomyces sp. IBSNAI002 TaxID=3457500 RepID=UPI003FD2099E